MLVIERRADINAASSEKLPLGFEERGKCRLRTRTASGEEVGIFLERGAVLRGGDMLLANDGRIVEVIAAPEPLMEASATDPLQLARAAYHLGNRHVAVHIAPGLLRFIADHVLGEMVQGLGLPVVKIVAPFEPEGGAYGGHAGHARLHGNDNAHGDGHGPRIHDHFTDDP